MLHYVRDDCRPDEINITLGQHDHSYVLTERLNCLFILPISLIALLLNSLSLFVFSRQRFDNRAVRFSLLSISCTEICLQLALITETVIVRSNFEHWHTAFTYTFTSCVHVAINALVSIRNWNVLLISAARCEVIVRPLASRRFLFFNRFRLAVAFGCVICVAVVLGLLANLATVGVLCANSGGLLSMENAAAVLAPEKAPGAPVIVMRSYLQTDLVHWAIYIFQALIPTVLIPCPTVIMWVRIRRSRLEREETTNRGAAMAAAPVSSMRASQMVLGLAILFCIFETPTFISTTILQHNPDLPEKLPVHPDSVTNALLVTDSVLNFFVYAASSAKFRADLADIFRRVLCPGRHRRRQRQQLRQQLQLRSAGRRQPAGPAANCRVTCGNGDIEVAEFDVEGDREMNCCVDEARGFLPGGVDLVAE